MTKTKEEWLAVMAGLIETDNLESLIKKIWFIQAPDEGDLAFFREIVDNQEKYGGDIVLPTIAVMATFFPDSVDIKFEEGAAERLFEKLLADGKLFE